MKDSRHTAIQQQQIKTTNIQKDKKTIKALLEKILLHKYTHRLTKTYKARVYKTINTSMGKNNDARDRQMQHTQKDVKDKHTYSQMQHTKKDEKHKQILVQNHDIKTEAKMQENNTHNND